MNDIFEGKEVSHQPLSEICVIEESSGIAGRLAGLLLADQGAKVISFKAGRQTDPIDVYLDRGKLLVDEAKESFDIADVIICDKVFDGKRQDWQVVLSITGAAPGDEVYKFGDSVSEDILKALIGYFSELAVERKLIDKEVTYTSLPLCSVYAAVFGATAVCASLADRFNHGYGREIVVSRMAAGLAAIGVFTTEVGGLPKHLSPDDFLKAPSGEVESQIERAKKDEQYFEWLKRRMNPYFACYMASDGQLIAPITGGNGYMLRDFLEELGVWGELEQYGLVERNIYKPENIVFEGRNIAYPTKLDIELKTKMADLIDKAVATKPAAYWENKLNKAGVVCAIVRNFDDWINSEQALASGLAMYLEGCDRPQLGRAARVDSGKPYPPLKLGRQYEQADKMEPVNEHPKLTKRPDKNRPPLKGLRVLDLANVIAGPACGLLLAELGAEIIKVDSMEPMHVPKLSAVLTGEMSQGKRSILLNVSKKNGKKILHQLAENVDFIVSNKLDPVLAKMGLDKDGLKKLNNKAIGVQVTGWKGEFETYSDGYPGYDPVSQAGTGMMSRFGSDDAPQLHGVASAVDYMTGYLAAFAGTVALFARASRGDGVGDWADSSLDSAASLLQFQYQAESPKTGTEKCLRQTKGGYICVSPEDVDLPGIESMEIESAITFAEQRGVIAVPVLTAKQIKERHRDNPTATVFFRKEGGSFPVLTFRPTWLMFDGELLPKMRQAPLPGADAFEILQTLGYSQPEIENLIDAGVVGKTLWGGQE